MSDLNGAALYLASDAASFTTGTDLLVDGYVSLASMRDILPILTLFSQWLLHLVNIYKIEKHMVFNCGKRCNFFLHVKFSPAFWSPILDL